MRPIFMVNLGRMIRSPDSPLAFFELIPDGGLTTPNKGKFLSDIAITVIPAEAGIQDLRYWIPGQARNDT